MFVARNALAGRSAVTQTETRELVTREIGAKKRPWGRAHGREVEPSKHEDDQQT
jgi:hypothetical protein